MFPLNYELSPLYSTKICLVVRDFHLPTWVLFVLAKHEYLIQERYIIAVNQLLFGDP